jgi:Na+-driven multidrug efflux pump
MTIRGLIAAAIVFLLASSTALVAQESGAGKEELAQTAANPIANLVSLPTVTTYRLSSRTW